MLAISDMDCYATEMCCRPSCRASWLDVAELVNDFTCGIATPGIRAFRLH
jgi:hypothetical protein